MVGTRRFTYVVRTSYGEYYCGITNDIERRMEEHRNERGESWFALGDRKHFSVCFSVEGDYESDIKRFGVAHFMNLIYKIEVSRP